MYRHAIWARSTMKFHKQNESDDRQKNCKKQPLLRPVKRRTKITAAQPGSWCMMYDPGPQQF